MLSGFKPSMSFDDISGSLDLSRTTGNLDGSRISGKIDASKIYGKLSNATIDAGHVNGLNALILSLISSNSSTNGDGITDLKKDENGYAKFNNGFLIQWGKFDCYGSDNNRQKVSFPKAFPNKCLNIFLTVSTRGVDDMNGNTHDDNNLVTAKTIDKLTTNSEFYFGWNFQWLSSGGSNHSEDLRIRYLAFGY
jgi:hypothetical protein